MRIDKATRRGFKSQAKKNLKKHYVTFVLMCLFASFIGAEFVTSDNFIAARSDVMGLVASRYEDQIVETERAAGSFTGASKFTDKIDQLTRDLSKAAQFEDEKKDEIFARSAGTINQIINAFADGTILSTVSSVVFNIVGSESVADRILIILSAVVALGFWMFVQLVYTAIMRRIVLEGRMYKSIPISRFLFFRRTKTWLKVSLTLALHTAVVLLSFVTVIVYPVIYYGFSLVPFIVAENPEIKPVKAMKLSWRMTRGYKFNLFFIDFTLFGWTLLGIFTAGLSNIFFSNAYTLSVWSEIYPYLRAKAIENSIPGSEFLNDRYLFEKCDMERLKSAYPEVVNVLKTPEYKLENLKGAKKFFAEHFGVVLWNTPDEMKYEENQASRQRIRNLKDEMEGLCYPTRLAPLPEGRKESRFANMHYMRHYSVLSLVIMFFIYSGFGWVWEVVYYYMLQGHYINRGVLHGPWLPIYGAGGIAILIFLFPLRHSPVKHFFATMALCGALEYGTSVVLEYAFGAEWWNYDGFFLNINGRICAEGLLVFGMAGLAFIYFLSPLLDDRIRKFNPKILMPIAIVLIALFSFDFVYSNLHPNMGDGITDGFAGTEMMGNASETAAESQITVETVPEAAP